jgi:guanylate cyclase
VFSPVGRLARIGVRPGDDEDLATRSGALILASVAISLLSCIWVGTYAAFGYWWSAAIPFTYQAVTFLGLLVLARTRRFGVFRATQLTMWLVLPPVLQVSLGGFVASSGVVLWSVMAPLGAVALLGARRSVPWFAGFLGIVVMLGLADPALSTRPALFPQGLSVAMIVLNICGLTTAAYVLLAFFVDRGARDRAALAQERERSDALLRNVLPDPIAERLKRGEEFIADRLESVTVLFADVVGFTQRVASMPPDRVVALLDRVFRAFDTLADAEGLEKIKTIGDAYMVVGGAPGPTPGHADAVARVALAMLDAVEGVGDGLQVRIGIDTGPVVAGVIGHRKFSYDLWGDTVNTASRMESHGVPGRIQMTARAAAALGPGFDVERRGVVDVKGKGPLETFFLRRPARG